MTETGLLEEITTKGLQIIKEPNNVLLITVFDHFFELEDGMEALEAVLKLCDGKPTFMLIDIRNAVGSTPETRSLIKSEELIKVIKATAFIVGNPLSRLIGNLFLGFSKPKFPVKLYNNSEDAREWLLSQ